MKKFGVIVIIFLVMIQTAGSGFSPAKKIKNDNDPVYAFVWLLTDPFTARDRNNNFHSKVPFKKRIFLVINVYSKPGGFDATELYRTNNQFWEYLMKNHLDVVKKLKYHLPDASIMKSVGYKTKEEAEKRRAAEIKGFGSNEDLEIIYIDGFSYDKTGPHRPTEVLKEASLIIRDGVPGNYHKYK